MLMQPLWSVWIVIIRFWHCHEPKLLPIQRNNSSTSGPYWAPSILPSGIDSRKDMSAKVLFLRDWDFLSPLFLPTYWWCDWSFWGYLSFYFDLYCSSCRELLRTNVTKVVIPIFVTSNEAFFFARVSGVSLNHSVVRWKTVSRVPPISLRLGFQGNPLTWLCSSIPVAAVSWERMCQIVIYFSLAMYRQCVSESKLFM